MTIRKTTIFLAALTVSACQTSSQDTLVSSQKKVAQNTAAEQSETASTTSTETGNATVASGAAKKVAADAVASYEPPKTGTVFTWRNNWANLPELISYKVAGRIERGGQEYLQLTSVKGFKNTTHAFYLAEDFSLKGYRDMSDKAVTTFKPTEKRYRFPMAPGDQWLTSWKQLDHKTKRVTSGGGVVKVMRWETLDLPAGKFKTLKVKMPVQKNAPRGLTHYTWFSPKLGVTVKEEIGGGILNWSQILEKVEYPK